MDELCPHLYFEGLFRPTPARNLDTSSNTISPLASMIGLMIGLESDVQRSGRQYPLPQDQQRGNHDGEEEGETEGELGNRRGASLDVERFAHVERRSSRSRPRKLD